METLVTSIAKDNQNDEQNKPNRACLEFWESEKTRPVFLYQENAIASYFESRGRDYLKQCMKHPTLAVETIKEMQLNEMKNLVELAYNEIPVYRKKYQAAGFKPTDLRTFEDIELIPIITKGELIKAFPDQCLNPSFKMEKLFPTRSSGSSGQTLLIRVDEEAILKDTIQGLRQFAYQSGFKYQEEHLLAHVYTVPWWISSIAGDYQTAFISNVLPPLQVAEHLRTIAPQILSCYPSNLEALLPFRDEFKNPLYLAVTHSEQSSRAARDEWARQLGCLVLDEYSSEEGTRMALEFPCGHYHVCEDTVLLEVLDPQTLKTQKNGQSGISVISNFLNTAMPFIRYVQGDCVTKPQNAEPCQLNWAQIESIDGRLNDAFINASGRKIPAGSLLDITYRWMFDCNLNLSQFELVQKKNDFVEARFMLGDKSAENRLKKAVSHLEELLAMCMEHHVQVKADIVASFSSTKGKRRPIRCEIDSAC